MRNRLLMTTLVSLPVMILSMMPAAYSQTGGPISEPSPRPTIDLRWTTSLAGTVLTSPVRFPTHRGFVVLHLSERQSDARPATPFTLAVNPHCVELARKTTNDEVIITPFDDGVCILTISDQFGTVATTQLYVGAQAIAQFTPAPAPSLTPSPEASATPLPLPTKSGNP